ncbi:hypothetical protein BDN71DRAFT_1439641 [Pleurotus eryngii]|uniref:Uncharacterized protein n=1 Tax=Pleurotus eryngii TaxID=5323 RepID=A0A9P6A8V4_PLEER|nr:hypothetical protein BDN71DRAFT_1439641 [Pleurotus eryngii]
MVVKYTRVNHDRGSRIWMVQSLTLAFTWLALAVLAASAAGIAAAVVIHGKFADLQKETSVGRMVVADRVATHGMHPG